MEKSVFSHPAVVPLLAQFVRVRLYTDGGKDKVRNQEMQQQRFNTVSAPFYVVLSPDDKPLATYEVPQIKTVDADAADFAAYLISALAAARDSKPVASQ